MTDVEAEAVDATVHAAPQRVSGAAPSGLGSGLASATALSVTGQAAALAAALIATPFVLRLLGTAQYGFLSLMIAILSYVVLADLGMGQASTRFAADALARGHEEEEVAVVWTAVVVTVGPALLAATALWIGAGSVAHVLHLPPALDGRAAICLRLLAVAGVARIAGNVLNTPQLARLSWRTFILVNSGTAVAQVALMPIVLLIWPNVIAAAALIAVTSLIGAAGQFTFSRGVQPKLLPPRMQGAPTRRLVTFGGALLIAGLANVPLFNASQFFLARLVSVRQVAYYAVAFTVAGLLAVGPFAISAPLLPALTRARHDRATLERIYRLALRLLALWIPPAAVVLFFAARPVLTVWAGPQYGVHSTDPFYILLVGMVLSVLVFGPQNVLAAHERTGIVARFRLIELIPFLAVTYVLIAAFGLIGAAIAWSMRFAAELIVFSVIVWRLTGLSPSGLLSGGSRHGLALLILIVPPAIAYALGAPGAAVLGVALVAAMIHTGYVWRSVLSVAERERVVGSLRRILRARRAR